MSRSDAEVPRVVSLKPVIAIWRSPLMHPPGVGKVVDVAAGTRNDKPRRDQSSFAARAAILFVR